MSQNIQSSGAIDPKITVVTVTYADRLKFLMESVSRVLDNKNIANVVVVSNASTSALMQLERTFGASVSVIRLPENTGSANGYAVGITEALRSESDYIMLMDDDNAPSADAIAVLLHAHRDMSRNCDISKLAVVGFRREHQSEIAAGLSASRTFARGNSFFGFHCLDLLFKVWRRIPGVMQRAVQLAVPPYMKMPYAPYGGLFFHRSVAVSLGVPDRSFILYGDDIEFTWRITKAGGQIWLVTGAEIEDLEASWNIRSRTSNSFEKWLTAGSDMRVFYSARNQAYFEVHCNGGNSLMYAINRFFYLKILALAARCYKADARLSLILKAVDAGTHGRLGLHPGFPL